MAHKVTPLTWLCQTQSSPKYSASKLLKVHLWWWIWSERKRGEKDGWSDQPAVMQRLTGTDCNLFACISCKNWKSLTKPPWFMRFAHTEVCCRDARAGEVSYYVHLVLDQGQQHSCCTQAVVRWSLGTLLRHQSVSSGAPALGTTAQSVRAGVPACVALAVLPAPFQGLPPFFGESFLVSCKESLNHTC